MTTPKIRTDNDIKVEYIDEMKRLISTHTEQGSMYRSKYIVYLPSFDKNELADSMRQDWILKWLNVLKEAFKQNKIVEGITTLEDLKREIHLIFDISMNDADHYESLNSKWIRIGDKQEFVYFDSRKLMEGLQ